MSMSHEYTEWNVSKANYQIEKGRKKQPNGANRQKTFFNVIEEPPWNRDVHTHTEDNI